MTPLTRFPAFRLLLGLCTGLLPALFIPSVALYMGAVVLAAGGVWWYFRRTPHLLFWAVACACGIWVGLQASGSTAGSPRPVEIEMKAVVTGRVERVLKRDSLYTRCLVRGTVDAQALPAQRGVGVVLTIFGASAAAESILQPGNRIYAAARVRLPRPAMLPGEMNERLYYSSLDVQWLAAASVAHTALLDRATSAEAVIQNVRTAIAEDIRRLFPEDTRGMALALVAGDRTALNAETRRTFSLAGTAHVLAVSGLHVGVIALALLVLLARLRLPWLRFGVYVTLLGVYTLLSGAQPSIVRATIMAVLLFGASLRQREAHLFNVLCLAVVVMIVLRPQDIFSVGLYLSVASLAGIALAYGPLEKFLYRFIAANRAWKRFVVSSLAVSLSASLVVGPLVAWFFSLYSVVSPLANLVVVPLMSLGMVYTFCAVLAAQLFEPLGSLFALSADALFRCAGWLTAGAASLPGAAVQGNMALWAALGASAATLYVGTAGTGRRAVFRTVATAAAMLMLFVLLHSTPAEVEIIPRRQMTAVVLPAEGRRRLVLLQDRRPEQYPVGDYGLERYLSAMGDTLTVIASGPASLFAASRIDGPVGRVVAASLRFKNPKMWPALDTLHARGIDVLNARQFLQPGHVLVLHNDTRQHILWNAWDNTLTLSGNVGNRTLCLPVLTEYKTFALNGE